MPKRLFIELDQRLNIETIHAYRERKVLERQREREREKERECSCLFLSCIHLQQIIYFFLLKRNVQNEKHFLLCWQFRQKSKQLSCGLAVGPNLATQLTIVRLCIRIWTLWTYTYAICMIVKMVRPITKNIGTIYHLLALFMGCGLVEWLFEWQCQKTSVIYVFN